MRMHKNTGHWVGWSPPNNTNERKTLARAHRAASRWRVEAGTDIGHIQKLLGHTDIRTTLIYAKVTDRDVKKKVRSPLDNL